MNPQLLVGLPTAVVFDCDGVLIDSEVLACGVEVDLLVEAGFDVTLADYMAKYVGRSMGSVLADLAAGGGTLPPDFDARSHARIHEVFARELRPIPGVAEVLQGLVARGVPIAVASSSPPDRLAHSLGLTGLLPYFAGHVYSATMVPRGKPAPDLFWHAAAALGVAPTACMVVEDGVVGVQGAIAAGMRVIGFVGGAHTDAAWGERLRAAGAHDVVDRMGAIAWPGLASRG